MNNELSKEAKAGFRMIASIAIGLPTFWWACWAGAQIYNGFKWWMIPTAVTQLLLAHFSISTMRSAVKMLEGPK